MVIIVTNRKCQIVQQSRVDRWRTVTVIRYCNKSEDNKNEYDKNNGKIVSLSHVITEKKKTLTSRTVQRSMSCILCTKNSFSVN